jgi:hypothetical protein
VPELTEQKITFGGASILYQSVSFSFLKDAAKRLGRGCSAILCRRIDTLRMSDRPRAIGAIPFVHVNHVLHVIAVSIARNITLALDEETLREARVLAAQRGLSVSAFLRSEFAGLVERQRGYTKAREAAVRRLRRGQSLGGGKLPSREKLHDPAKLR